MHLGASTRGGALGTVRTRLMGSYCLAIRAQGLFSFVSEYLLTANTDMAIGFARSNMFFTDFKELFLWHSANGS